MEAAEAELAAIAGGRGGRLRIASVPERRRNTDAAGDRRLQRLPPRGRVTLAEGEPEEIAPAPAWRRVRPRPALRIRGSRRAPWCRHQALRAARGPAPPGPARRPPAGPQALRLEDLREESWMQTSALEPLRPPRGPLLPRRRVRAPRLLRERRLPDRAGPGRRRRRRRPDPSTGALDRARATSASAPCIPRSPRAQGLRRDPPCRRR